NRDSFLRGLRYSLSRPAAKGELLRRGEEQASEVSDQQLYAVGADDCRHLQATLAGGAILQMDQAASAHQGLLRNQRERREDPNLDCGVDLCAGGDRAQKARAGGQSLPDSTDSQCYSFRENAHFTGTSAVGLR